MNNHWLEWATEIQAIAQAGLTYGSDVFDRERYTRLREIAAQIIAEHTDLPVEKVADLFCNEEGYQTPKLDTRAVITCDQAILLVRENDGRWAMPGGWADVGLTLSQNVEKETREEAGLDVVATRFLPSTTMPLTIIRACRGAYGRSSLRARFAAASSSITWRRRRRGTLRWIICPRLPRARRRAHRLSCALRSRPILRGQWISTRHAAGPREKARVD
ncbi:NUDIX hydrolase N-terminal domain-containing protein [Trueperella pyogenes]|uniref:NUDIX hydrolase n=1 Tax=Trueperella pyogenes TaxID=1661 RepID=UPI003246754D